ncbi:MAG: cytidylate kinase-like family protein [Synergistaceae bacterium]|jgi:cytidylate kinase|nr:cytidylate kinase-like family protein [Synergistaceae bacterium]
MKRVITISREFGSGGRLVGERLAAKLGMRFYDKALIYLAVIETGLDPATIEKVEEEATSKFLFHLAIGEYVSSGIFSKLNAPISDQVFFAQSKVIEDLGERGDCVIIGRCASHVLRRRADCVRAFVYASEQDKLKRIVEDYGVPAKDAPALMAKMDKGRANYWEYYTDSQWGSVKNYDLCVNTSTIGIDGAVDVIAAATRSEEKHDA